PQAGNAGMDLALRIESLERRSETTMRTSSVLGVAALCALVGLVGCGGGPQQQQSDNLVDEVEGWWDNPGLIRTNLASVGLATVVNENTIPMARRTAEVDARAKLAEALKARIISLSENWAKEAGDLVLGEKSMSSLINNETMVQQYANAVVQGSVPHKYKIVGKTQYVLMVLHNPEEWTQNLLDEVESQALRDDTLWRTELMKNDFRKRLDEFKKGQLEQAQADRQVVEQAIPAQ